jgi:hypothetical protein
MLISARTLIKRIGSYRLAKNQLFITEIKFSLPKSTHERFSSCSIAIMAMAVLICGCRTYFFLATQGFDKDTC